MAQGVAPSRVAEGARPAQERGRGAGRCSPPGSGARHGPPRCLVQWRDRFGSARGLLGANGYPAPRLAGVRAAAFTERSATPVAAGLSALWRQGGIFARLAGCCQRGATPGARGTARPSECSERCSAKPARASAQATEVGLSRRAGASACGEQGRQARVWRATQLGREAQWGNRVGAGAPGCGRASPGWRGELGFSAERSERSGVAGCGVFSGKAVRRGRAVCWPSERTWGPGAGADAQACAAGKASGGGSESGAVAGSHGQLGWRCCDWAERPVGHLARRDSCSSPVRFDSF